MTGSTILISGDSHVFETRDLWTSRGDRSFGDRLPRVVSEELEDYWYFDGKRAVACRIAASTGDRFDPTAPRRKSRANEARLGGYDPEARLVDLEQDGVYGEVLYPTVGMFAFRWIADSLLLDEICRSYNDWLADFCSADPNRFKGAAMLNVDDVDVAVAEVKRIAAKGMPVVLMPVDPGDGLTYADPRFDPLWAALQDANVKASFHLLTNREKVQGSHESLFGGPWNTVVQSYSIQLTFAAMILGGVFERFPDLKVVAVEFEAGWSAAFVNNMDRTYKVCLYGLKHPDWKPYKDRDALPSTYFSRNVYMTWQEDDFALQVRNLIGVDRLLWGSDYPHGSGTFPNSRPILDSMLTDVSAEERARLVCTNTAELYGFDLSKVPVPVGRPGGT